MLVTFAVAIGLFTPSISFAGSGDISMIAKSVKGQQKSEVIPWGTYDSGAFTWDLRANFDWTDTFGAFVGKSFKVGSITINPEIGLIWGQQYKAVSPEFMSYGGKGAFFWVALNQVALGSGKDRPNFAYHWVEARYKFDKYNVELGAGEQVYYEWTSPGADPLLDIGPVLKVNGPSQMYAKAWWTRNPETGTEKFFLTIGKGF